MSLRIKLCFSKVDSSVCKTANLVSVLCSAKRFLLLMEIVAFIILWHSTWLLCSMCGDPYLLLSKFQPAATLANPFHSLIDLKGQCGFLHAWEKPSVFYYFLLWSMTGAHLPFASWSVAFEASASSFLSLVSWTQLCSRPFLLVGRSSTAWFELQTSRHTLTSVSQVLRGSLFWKGEEGRERSYFCWKGMVVPELVTKG